MSKIPDVFNKNQRHKFDERYLEKCYCLSYTPPKKRYWNIWRVVFTGWLIRYPGKIFNIFRFPLFVLIGAIVVVLCSI